MLFIGRHQDVGYHGAAAPFVWSHPMRSWHTPSVTFTWRASVHADMSGIMFFRTENRGDLTSFYTDRLEFDVWLQQEGGCTILQYDNLLVGFCDGTETETEGIITIVLEDEAAVDDMHRELADVARGRPEENDDFDIYHFFADDPDGRTLEIQTFLHRTPAIRSDENSA